MGFGGAFAGRGASLNDAIEGLRPLVENLGPVSRVLADPSTQLERFITSLARTAEIVAPVSDQQAQFFTNAAIAFDAIARDPEALKATISEGPPTLETAIDTLPRQRPFLAEFAELSRRLRPGVQDLRVALPVLNSAIDVGTPVLARTPAMNRDLREVLVELDDLVAQSSTALSFQRLRDTFDSARRFSEWFVPAQTVCNYWNYWFTFLPEALSDRDQVGYSFRQALTNAPPGPVSVHAGPGHRSRSRARRMARSPATRASRRPASTGPCRTRLDDGMFEPRRSRPSTATPSAPRARRMPTARAASPATSSAGCRFPASPPRTRASGVADIPGCRGPTTLYYGENAIQPDGSVLREFRDTRVPSRQP